MDLAAFDGFFAKKASTLKKISLRTIYVDEFLKNLGLCQNIESFIACEAEIDLKYVLELSHLKELILLGIEGIASKAWITFFKKMNRKKLESLVLSRCRNFDIFAFKELLRLHFPEMKTLHIDLWWWIALWGPEDDENLNETIKEFIENCPKLRNVCLFGGAAKIDNHFILAMFKDFNVHISIDESHFKNEYFRGEQQQKSLEKYMKNYDSQLFEKYMKMDKGSQWASKLSSYD